MAPILEFKSVGKTYQRGKQSVEVLNDLSLSVDDGDFLALMGPSGSGKSTVLNLAGGLDTPTSGEIIVKGEPISKISGSGLARWRADQVGFVFQFYHLMPHFSAARNVELPLLLTNLSRSERKKRVSAALELVGIADRAKHKPNEMSGGQQQRTAIARAIVADPTLVLCDEPTGDLDRSSADEILDLLKDLNQSFKKTIIMVTHDPKAAACAANTLHLDKGQLVNSPTALSA